MKKLIKKIDWQKGGGLLPAVIQSADTGQVLMLGYMNPEALAKTVSSGRVWFYSRTKKRLWMKGEVSKHILKVVDILLDCDNDTLLLKVNPVGPTCHTGSVSCFQGNRTKIQEVMMENGLTDFFPLINLFERIKQRKLTMPKGSYTASLFKDGLDKICQKIYEEAAEVVVAAKKETNQRLCEEATDLIYHLLVLLVQKNLDLEDIIKEIGNRRK